MERYGNIIVGDQSALFLYLHDKCNFIEREPDEFNPLLSCAKTSEELHAFNFDHWLFGAHPVELLVPHQELRRHSSNICCRCTGYDLPSDAFYELRSGLHITSPELTFVRMGQRGLSTVQLAEIATNLCARYYLSSNGEILDRPHYVTTTKRLGAFLKRVEGMRGVNHAKDALQFAMDNSGSPIETKMMLQYRLPLHRGGMNLPFTHMNYDVEAGRLAQSVEQTKFCIDLVDHVRHFGIEYDGQCHDNPSKDKQRINELAVLGWTVFPLDSRVLYNAENTIRAGKQIAKMMNLRIRRDDDWEKHFKNLRRELGLPC